VKVAGHNYSEIIPDQYIITLDEPMVEGERYEVGITFVAPIASHRADGLYRSKYINPKTDEPV
jgi:hypothetical protein